MQEVKIIADSVSPSGVRLTTFQLKYQRFIHSEFMTHRVFSRNASSSRAIPVAKMIEQVRNDPAMPHEWGKNIAGMQAKENLAGSDEAVCKSQWLEAAKSAAYYAESMMHSGLHKQIANRILEPFQWSHVVVTATEWDNFFKLRNHVDAQPEIRDLAKEMRRQYESNVPTPLNVGEWHLPYITSEERDNYAGNSLRAISAARCCRVSYMKHDGNHSKVEEDIALHDRLVTANPPHMSPVEHQALCTSSYGFNANFYEWKQYRYFLENRD